MFDRFRRRGEASSVPSLDALSFDAVGYALQGEPQPGRLRVWHTPEGDGLGVYFFEVPPDLPANNAAAGELAAHYRRLLGDSGGKLVETRVARAGGVPALRTVLSLSQSPSGRTYVGSLTVPFRDFSFVLKCQCVEAGPTGLKAALLFERSRAAGEPTAVGAGRFGIPGFDPDDPRHDADLPRDPVARARRVLDHLAGTLKIAAGVRALPGFALRPPRE